MNDERLESLLRSAGQLDLLPPEPAPDLAEWVLRAAALRQKRRRQKFVAAGLAGCYLGGMLTMWLCLPTVSTQTITNAATPVAKTLKEPSPRAAPVSASDDRARLQNERPVDAIVADSSAQNAPNPRKALYELFRDLGDASHARGDFASAIHYYRLALDSASEADFQAAAGHDNLLLLSLKQDRIESTLRKSQGESI